MRHGRGRTERPIDRIDHVEVRFDSLDGLRLAGTVALPSQAPIGSVVLLHGNGSDRNEMGLFSRLADALGRAGIVSLRFDLRGHGASEGRQEDRTLSAHLNDVRAALGELRDRSAAPWTGLVATSFSGGVASWYAAHRPGEVSRLVLLNPQLDHKRRFIDDHAGWVDDRLDLEHTRRLNDQGYLDRSGGVRFGRALLNEVFWMRAQTILPLIETPTLLLHGTMDQHVAVESSRAAARRIPDALLVELEGAAHGFAAPGDDEFSDPRTRTWQSQAIDQVVAWLARGPAPGES